jgi:hypothetical protein
MSLSQWWNSYQFSSLKPPARSSPSANTWTSLDVTSYITGNGIYNVAFSTTSSTHAAHVSFSSREGANASQLVIQTGSGPTNTPGPTLSGEAALLRAPFSFFLFGDFIRLFFLSHHLRDIIHSVLVQPLMTVFGIIALSHFKLLHKANHSNQTEFTGKRRQASDADLLRGHHLDIH